MLEKVIVIGAGPGGLASAMILASRGYKVKIYEKQPLVGGRTSPIKIKDYTFDLGPTFVMLPQIFEEVFNLSGEKLSDHLDWKRLDQLYRLRFSDNRDLNVYFNKDEFKKEIKRLFPEDVVGFEKFIKAQEKKFNKMYPCLKVPYGKWHHYLRWKLLKAIPYLDLHTSVYGVLSRYFYNEEMKMAMTFQSKYLGMSPWNCPGAFSILSYIEHAFGIFHPIGGVHKITEAMAKIAREKGAEIILNTNVQEILLENKRVIGVKLFGGKVDKASKIIMNADFAQGLTEMIPEKGREKTPWSNERLSARPYSCSTFMLYLGIKKRYNIPHHNIFFSNNYRSNIEEIFDYKVLSKSPSFYLHNPIITDPSLAPDGKSPIYILVPVPNLNASINWEKEKNKFRDLIIKEIKERTELTDIESHIEVEKLITPDDWQYQRNVYKGAVFNLAHSINQMLYLRPNNEFKELPGLYLSGGGTHPGSGLPTILESGRITADLISIK